MKENKFDTVKKAGNKNSIEEDIKIVENYLAHSAINETDSDFFKNGGWEIVDLEILKSMQHILSDYKRVLKENEELKYKVEGQECVIETQAHNEEVYERIFERLEKEKQDYFEKYRYHLQQNESLTKEFSNVIPIQKVKDKIEEIGEKIKYEENEKVVIYLHKQKNILQELLESEE